MMELGAGYTQHAPDEQIVDDFTFLPGTVSLVEEVDQRVLVVLQDGRKLLGVLRSFDQYANLVLEQTIERIVVGEQYADKALGLFLVRGDNIVLLGPIDADREELCVKNLAKVTVPVIEAARKAEREAKRAQWEARSRTQLLLTAQQQQDPWS